MNRLGMVALMLAFAVALGAGCASDPGFTVSRHEGYPEEPALETRFWRITNTRDEPLLIKRLAYNGEWEAPLTDERGLKRKEGGLPVRLTVGESCNFLEYSYAEDPQTAARNRAGLNMLLGRGAPPEPATPQDYGKVYRKRVVYIDIETDRGKFRYRPAE